MHVTALSTAAAAVLIAPLDASVRRGGSCTSFTRLPSLLDSVSITSTLTTVRTLHTASSADSCMLRNVRAAELHIVCSELGDACDHLRSELDRHGSSEHGLVAEGPDCARHSQVSAVNVEACALSRSVALGYKYLPTSPSAEPSA